MTFGIIGYGRFGQLWANALSALGEVHVYDRTHISTKSSSIQFVTLPEAAACDIVFIIVPISEFESTCTEIKNLIRPDSIVIDCCSVKTYPATIMQKTFSKQQPLIATHPLFGPDSVHKSGGMMNHKIVICPLQVDTAQLDKILNLLHQLQLNVLITTPEDHDKQMANSQGLVHFIGRGLAALNLEQQEISTPDFQALININKMVVNDTWQLFLDMHRYNPYTRQVREQFLQQLNIINNEVNRDH